jgi:hypothetical protein
MEIIRIRGFGINIPDPHPNTAAKRQLYGVTVYINTGKGAYFKLINKGKLQSSRS